MILIAGLMLSSLAGGQTPNGPVFTITLEQKGSVEDKSFKKSLEAMYWPCAAWNSGYSGVMTSSEMSKTGARMNASPEGLLAGRGSIAAMKPGETLLFYIREKSGSGNDGVSSVSLSTVGDGVFSYTVVTENDTWTSAAGGPVTDPGRRAFGPAGNTEAVIKRTADGAVLTFIEPDLEGEGDSDFFSLFSQDNEPAEMPDVLTFKLSNDDLKNWPALVKVNDRTLNGAIDGTLHTKATLRGGAISYIESEVTLGGCIELGIGQQGQVAAAGKPEGGKYRYWTEPSDMMTIESDGATATITGASPGRGTLFVEYISPEGKTSQASQPATCVRIESYNGGDAIPQIPLFDIDGKKLAGVLKVPVAGQPSKIEELVDFIPADNTIITANGLENSLELIGNRQGKTTLQAKTSCGSITGPVIDVEVVNCDDETIATLNRMLEVAKENQRQAYGAIQRILGSADFEKAASEIAKSTYNLAEKTALLIIGTLTGEGMNASAAAINTAKILEAGASFKDIVTSENNWEVTSNVLQVFVSQFGSDLAQAFTGGVEAGKSATEFGTYLGQLIGTNIELKSAMEQAEQANKNILEIDRLQRLCRRSTEQPKEQEGAKPKPAPKPGEPKPVTEPTPATVTPPAEETPTEEPGENETPVTPPAPAEKPWQVGLPYKPDECGCNSSQGLGTSQEGFLALQTGMQNLNECVDNFHKVSLTGYLKTLQDWTALSESLVTSTRSGQTVFQLKAKEAVSQIDSLLQRTQSFDEAGKDFLRKFEKCPGSLSSGVEVLRSAKKLTDTITTNY